MAKRGERKNKPMVGDVTDPRGLGRLLLAYLEWMRVHNYSEATIRDREFYLRSLIEWMDERDIRKAGEVTRAMLERYQRYLYHYRKADGHPLSFSNQIVKLVGVKGFFKWLARQKYIENNPASEIELPRREKRLPKYVLTPAEAEAIINATNVKEAMGIRDRAILETLYSTGMRRMELIGLGIYDVDANRGTVMIRQGKGKKDRIVPIGERAIGWIEKYQQEVRPQLVAGADNSVLFLTRYGEGLTADHLSQTVSNYIERAEINKKGSCHLFRHTVATLMLENGADIRFIQQMLGHASLESTKIYTQVSIRQLKEIHTATHPARMYSREPSQEESGEEKTREELLSALEAEAAEEEKAERSSAIMQDYDLKS